MSDWYNNLRDIQRRQLEHDLMLEANRLVSPGEIVSEGGSTTYNDMGLSYTWIKLRSNDASRVAALNMTAVTTEGTPILAARDPKPPYSWQILGPDPAYVRTGMILPISQYGSATHGSNHQTAEESDPGPDPVYVFQPMLYLLKTVGDGVTLTVSTYPYDYNQGGASKYFGGADTDLTSSVPGAGLVRKVLLYLDRDLNILQTVEGATVVDNDVVPIPLPQVPDGVSATKTAWVKLSNGQSAIVTATHIDDARDFLGAGDGTSGGSGLDDPTEPDQMLFADDALQPIWALPVIDETDYSIVIDEATLTIVYEG